MKGDFFPLQASLISPNFPARQPPVGGNKFFSFFVRRLPYREVFGIWREVRWGCRVRLRARLLSGARRGVYAFCKCRLIPPHQSLTRQLPPKGKPSVRCANMANMALHCGLPLRSALTSRLRDKLLAVFFQPKGKPSLHCANMANSCVYIANKNANIANKNLRSQ